MYSSSKKKVVLCFVAFDVHVSLNLMSFLSFPTIVFFKSHP
jgi:hypothetical protein